MAKVSRKPVRTSKLTTRYFQTLKDLPKQISGRIGNLRAADMFVILPPERMMAADDQCRCLPGNCDKARFTVAGAQRFVADFQPWKGCSRPARLVKP